MADRIASRSSSTSGSCKPTDSSKGVPVISMFSNTYWKRKERGLSGLAELTMPPQGRGETITSGTFGKSCSPSFYIVSGIVLSVLCCPPKKGDLGRYSFHSNRQKDAYAEEICTRLTALEKVLFSLWKAFTSCHALRATRLLRTCLHRTCSTKAEIATRWNSYRVGELEEILSA